MNKNELSWSWKTQGVIHYNLAATCLGMVEIAGSYISEIINIKSIYTENKKGMFFTALIFHEYKLSDFAMAMVRSNGFLKQFEY